MGFTREQASDALTHTTSLEQATEYILTHCLPTSSTATAAAVETPVSLNIIISTMYIISYPTRSNYTGSVFFLLW